MHFYKSATRQDAKGTGQGELLHWEAIKHWKLLGAKFYDLSKLEKERLPAIYKFKYGFSNRKVTYSKYTKNSTIYKITGRI